MTSCVDHLNYVDEVCPHCSLPVDSYGNTKAEQEYCSFPDCGCDGARLCMAGEASSEAMYGNVEGMWGGSSKEQKRARFDLLSGNSKGKKS